jgi:hypothetical protein
MRCATRIFVVALAVSSWGCANDGVDGDWTSANTVQSHRNRLTVVDDGTSSSELWVVYVQNQQTQAGMYRFTAGWIEGADGSARFAMKCQESPFGACEGDDFAMTCSLDDEALNLRCSGDDTWADYQLDWQRVEE